MGRWGRLRGTRAEHRVALAVEGVGAMQVARGAWGRRRLAAKRAGARAAASDPLWADTVVPVYGGPLMLVSPWVDIEASREQEERALLRDRLARLEDAPLVPAARLVGWPRLRSEWSGIGVDKGTLDACERVLGQLPLPRSSAHGDLHRGNLGRSGNDTRLIDWESYSPRSSLAFDLANYETEAAAEATGAPWERSLGVLPEAPLISATASRWSIPATRLVLAYVVQRLGRHTRVLEGVRHAPGEKLRRHVTTLRRAVEQLAD